MPETALRYTVQAILYGLFAAVVGCSRAGRRTASSPPTRRCCDCRFGTRASRSATAATRSAEELAKLPPQLRAGTELPARAFAGAGARRARRQAALRRDRSRRRDCDATARRAATAACRSLPASTTLRVQVNDDARSEGATYERSRQAQRGARTDRADRLQRRPGRSGDPMRTTSGLRRRYACDRSGRFGCRQRHVDRFEFAIAAARAARARRRLALSGRSSRCWRAGVFSILLVRRARRRRERGSRASISSASRWWSMSTCRCWCGLCRWPACCGRRPAPSAGSGLAWLAGD